MKKKTNLTIAANRVCLHAWDIVLIPLHILILLILILNNQISYLQ